MALHLPSGLQLARFRPRLLDSLKGYRRSDLAKDVSAGLTVGVVALPLAMAFAIGSGVGPEVGIYTAIICGLLTSLLGGSNLLVGGPAGAFIVIIYGIIERYGLANLLISTMLAGVLMFVLGLLRLGVLVRYIPVSIVIGFTNGIAVLIALSQVRSLLGLQVDKLPADFFSQIATLAHAIGTLNVHALALGLACLGIIVLYPRLLRLAFLSGPRLRPLLQVVPASMVTLVLATVVVTVFQLPVETIGSVFGQIPRGLPSLDFPDVSWETAKLLVMPTLTIALLGSVESLLTARVADNQQQDRAVPGEALPRRHDPNQELMGQGVANFVGPLFGCIPSTGTVARTVTNIRSGAVSPIAGVVHALTLLLIVLAAAPLAEYVPLPALSAILLFVAWNMGDWREFGRLRQFSVQYRTILVGTFLLTVIFDLTVAIEVGLVLACVFFIYRMSTLFRMERLDPIEAVPGTPVPEGVCLYRCYGTLFFGAVTKVERLLEDITARRAGGEPCDAVVLEMHRLISIDTTGVDALEQMHKALHSMGVALVLADLNEQPRSLLERSGFAQRLGADHLAPDLPTALQRLRHAARPLA